MSLKTIQKTYEVLSYCAIPEKIAETYSRFEECTCDVFIEHKVTPRHDQPKYDDDFTLDNWIIQNKPELEGKTILIHIDY